MARSDDHHDIYSAIRDANQKAGDAMEKTGMAIEMIKIHQAECVGRQKVIDLYLKVITGLLGAFATGGMGIAAALATRAWKAG